MSIGQSTSAVGQPALARNAARDLNPDRQDKAGVGDDGSKTLVPVGTEAA